MINWGTDKQFDLLRLVSDIARDSAALRGFGRAPWGIVDGLNRRAAGATAGKVHAVWTVSLWA